MAAAIGALVLGGLLVASGLKGVSITDLVAGVGGTLNPAGGRKEFASSSSTDPNLSPGSDPVSTTGGAKELVDSLVQVAQAAGGGGVTVVSDSRPGSTTSSGNVSDHASNDSHRAARDIGVKGTDALVGPPPKELDRAIVAVGQALGRHYRGGVTVVDTFHKGGLQIQVIWRTPAYGGHMGHIHVGAHTE